MSKIQQIQTILEVRPDGIWGPKSQAALALLIGGASAVPSPSKTQHHVLASSFADARDIASFKKWRQIFLDRGFSLEEAEHKALAYGDNAVGCWNDDTSEGSGPSCALPPEDMIERWGSVDAAKHKPVQVVTNGELVLCTLKDRMPIERYRDNGAGIDLNPDACKAADLTPPIMTRAIWWWA